MIGQGGVAVTDAGSMTKITSESIPVDKADGEIFKVGKRKFKKVVFEE
jgi:hypothetical protein